MLDTHGFGMSSVRFICGTQDIHKTLEKNLNSTDRRYYFICSRFDANGVFEPLLGRR
jgi:glycine C-acetyltransferase